jgi:hypothetical protein
MIERRISQRRQTDSAPSQPAIGSDHVAVAASGAEVGSGRIRSRTQHAVTLRAAFNDPQLLAHVMAGDSFKPQRTLLLAAMGERLTAEEREIFTHFTGRDHEPNQRVAEFCMISGRRTAKTVTLSAAATYLSTLVDYRNVLIPAETGVLLVLAQSQHVATQILDLVESNLDRSPVLRQLVVRRTQDAIELSNNIRIEVRPASFRKLRGPTYIAIIADELAFWYIDEATYQDSDVTVLAAARPGLMTTRGPVLLASSPYARRGVLWETFNKHYGANGAPLVLVAKGTTAELNPTIPEAEIQAELERDPVRNISEYLAEFRLDVEGFVSLDVVLACIAKGVYERAYDPNFAYEAFCDPSGGRVDAMTLCIAHMDYARQTVVIDAIREAKSPFSPEATVEDFSKLLHDYHITGIQSDKYGGIWPVEMFGKNAILCEQSARPKSDLYRDMLPLLNSARISLLDHPKLVQQLVGLERQVARGGKDSIDHSPSGADDICNSVAGVCCKLAEYGSYDPTNSWVSGNDHDSKQQDARAWRAQQLHAALTHRINLANMPIGRRLW